MQDIALDLAARPGSLAQFGHVLGAADVSLEGGGVFTVDGRAHAHFLVGDGTAAQRALADAGLGTAEVRDVVLLRLDQGRPGQLGEVAQLMADEGVDIQVQYSDHDNQLVLVVPEPQHETALKVADRWSAAAARPPAAPGHQTGSARAGRASS
ncbi:MAG: amino acid-binding protein [Mycobacteriales bacterium]